MALEEQTSGRLRRNENASGFMIFDTRNHPTE
jgi:hypothetical protein